MQSRHANYNTLPSYKLHVSTFSSICFAKRYYLAVASSGRPGGPNPSFPAPPASSPAPPPRRPPRPPPGEAGRRRGRGRRGPIPLGDLARGPGGRSRARDPEVVGGPVVLCGAACGESPGAARWRGRQQGGGGLARCGLGSRMAARFGGCGGRSSRRRRLPEGRGGGMLRGACPARSAAQ